MNKSNIEAKINYNACLGQTEIYFFIKENGKFYIAKPMKFEFTAVEENTICEPSIKLGINTSVPFLQAMANLCHEHGIKPEKEPVLKNELDAIKYHLEDMRKLVFKNNRR